MAIVTLASKFSFSTNQDWDWMVAKLSSSFISVENANYRQSFDGSFAITPDGIITGNATASNFYVDDALVYSITGMTADATQLQVFVENEGDTQQTYAFVLSGNDTINGSADADVLAGFGGNDTMSGGAGNDLIIAGSGNDTISGGAGNDTVIFSGARANYTVVKTAAGITVTDKTGADGIDTVSGAERVLFTDSGIAFDGSGNGGEAYRVYQAAFNRTPDKGGVGYWINAMDKGMSLKEVAQNFVASAEFKVAYGAAPSNAELVGKFYENVLHRQPEKGGFDFWVGVLDRNQASVADVLEGISESGENVAGLAAVIGAGFEYSLY